MTMKKQVPVTIPWADIPPTTARLVILVVLLAVLVTVVHAGFPPRTALEAAAGLGVITAHTATLLLHGRSKSGARA